MMKFGAVSELSKINIASSGGAFYPLFFDIPPVRFIIQDGRRAIKGLFISCPAKYACSSGYNNICFMFDEEFQTQMTLFTM